ncbi:hypothetical protein D6D25_03977 [Aureobasidium pullulans]|nr:hypothetical protein D6D25_03977 [Aureobasidium pullulans]
MIPLQEQLEQDLLDQLDRTRLPELQYLSTYCPFTLNAKCCPHGSKCLLKKVCYVLCAFRTTGSYCDGDHQVSAICQQFLTTSAITQLLFGLYLLVVLMLTPTHVSKTTACFASAERSTRSSLFES